MCGIVGYIGNKQASPILLDALEKLEYRGYDSAGIAVIDNNKINIKKCIGKIENLRSLVANDEKNGSHIYGNVGIGHTRWATHGKPSDVNSHPHISQSGMVAVVHNGIVENYMELRTFLESKGYKFVSDTDTEIIVQLIDFYYTGDPVAAVRQAISRLSGSYALGIMFADYPWQLIAFRKGSPLIIGLSDGENYIASDIPAILEHTKKIIRLGEQELAVITSESVSVFNSFGERIHKEVQEITWNIDAAQKGGYEHFMIKEIMEQPTVIKNTVSPRISASAIDLGLKNITDKDFRRITNVVIVACGSAYHVGVVAKMLIEKYARIPARAEIASEFRYSDPMVNENTLTIVISQSGETIDTQYAMREAKSKGSKTLSIVNVVGSSIASESDDVIYTWAGTEIAVATTKAYSAQLAVSYLLAFHIAKCRGCIGEKEEQELISELERIPDDIEKLLEGKNQIQFMASKYFNAQSIFFIGRNIDHALALEGSLKLKEVSYIHSEAYAAGELKHGTISLIEDGTLVVALATYMPLFEKTVSNIKEVKARGAQVIAITSDNTSIPEDVADNVVYIPSGYKYIEPMLSIIPLQLFAYYVAANRGCDIDKPRNLAKSVTVE